METLPALPLTTICDYLTDEGKANFTLTCRATVQAISTHHQRQGNNTAGCYTLKRAQLQIRNLMLENEPHHIIFQAPMSYGKTATGLSIALHNWTPGSWRVGGVWLIVVPSNAVDTWLKEAQKMYGPVVYQSGSEQSPLLIPQKSKIHAAMAQPNQFTRAIIITMGMRTFQGSLAVNTHIIFDESHKKNKVEKFVKPDRKALMLSASDTKDEINYVHFRTFFVPDVCVQQHLPTPVFHMMLTDKMQLHFNKPNDRDFEVLDYVRYVQAILNKNLGRVVVFCPGPTAKFKEMFAHLTAANPTRLVTKFAKSTAVITKFERSGCGIMMVPHSASEAININPDCMIIIRGDWVNKERINQLIGRGLRTTNPLKYVNIYHVLPNGMPRLRTLYTNACLMHNVHLDQVKSMKERLVCSFRLMNVLDEGLKATTSADMVAIINLNDWPVQEMYDWWITQKSAYSDELKKKVLFSPF